MRLQKMDGFHKHETEKLEAEIASLKSAHQEWVDQQTKENEDWNHERR